MKFGKTSIGVPSAYFDLSREDFFKKFAPSMGKSTQEGWEFIQSEKRKNVRKNSDIQPSEKDGESKADSEPTLDEGSKSTRRSKSNKKA